MKEDLLVERLVNRVRNANTNILIEIGKVLKQIGELRPSDIYKIQQELKYGESLQRIVDIIEEISNINKEEIIKILEAVANRDQEFAKVYYEARGIDYIPLKENRPLQLKLREIEEITLGRYNNIANTSVLTYLDSNGNEISKPIIQAYWDVVDEAVMNVSMGKETFQEALSKQIKTLASNGIRQVEYESGYKRNLYSAVRMNMQDALKEMAIEQQRIIGDQFENDAWEVSVHANPAPDHEEIQGHIFDLKNWEKMNTYQDYEDINGKSYPTLDRHIGQWNCYHIAFATVKSAKPRYTQEQLDKIIKDNNKGFDFDGRHYSMYEGTQLQRRIENELRKYKDIKDMAKASGDNKTFLSSSEKIKQLNNKYIDLCKISGLQSYIERARSMKG